MPPTSSIVIVNYNGRDWLEPCLREALAQATDAGAEVILVDNGSADGSVAFVAERFPGVVTLCLDRNEGFAAGANAGTRAARSDTVVLLNNDAVPERGWLGALMRELEPENVALAASVIREARYPEAYEALTSWIDSGELKYREHIVDGLEAMPALFCAQLRGEIFGRALGRLTQ